MSRDQGRRAGLLPDTVGLRPGEQVEESSVRVTLVPSSVGPSAWQYLTTVLLNDNVAIDAGCLGLHGAAEEQGRVRDVFLTHSHIDHLASLPIFLNNILRPDGEGVTIHGNEAVLDCLRRDLFNGRLWPDFLRLTVQGKPFVTLKELRPRRPVAVAGLRLTPVEVDHVVPTLGFLVEDESATVVFPSDTGPTEAIWRMANRARNLKAIFLEATFPDEQSWLADVSGHLTPALFAQEVRKVKHPVPFIVVHIHPRSRETIVRELQTLGLPDVQIGRFGTPYDF
jgi:ribonuclease BN (tRNA processing enzyme)